MAQRFSCKNVVLPQAGTAFTHGLTNQYGAAVAPDEWFINLRTGMTNIDSRLYLVSTPTSGSISVAATSGAGQTADVFCAVNHSIVK